MAFLFYSKRFIIAVVWRWALLGIYVEPWVHGIDKKLKLSRAIKSTDNLD